MGTRGGVEEEEDPVATGLSLGSTGGRAPVQPKAVVRGAPPVTESGHAEVRLLFPAHPHLAHTRCRDARGPRKGAGQCSLHSSRSDLGRSELWVSAVLRTSVLASTVKSS